MSSPTGSNRRKTQSESSDGGDVFPAVTSDAMDIKYLYDVDGKFPYSVYAKKPEFYDIDGKHTYKYFNQLKHITSGSSAASKKPEAKMSSFDDPAAKNVVYDVDGKFSYTVYNPNLHEKRFASRAK